MATPTKFSDLLPKLPGRGTQKSLSSLFPEGSPLREWQPSQTRPRDYTQGGVWNRAYIDSHGALPEQLHDAYRAFTSRGFWRRRNPETSLWEYQEASDPQGWRGQTPPSHQRLLDEGWTLHRGVGGEDPANWKRYAHDPRVQPFLDRYAPNPERALVTPPINAPEIVERLGRQQAERVQEAGRLHREQLVDSARRLLEQLRDLDAGAQQAARAAQGYKQDLDAIAQRLATPLTQDELEKTPGYQVRQAEGRRSVGATLAGAGLSQSGARGRALLRRASEIASEEYGAADARRRANAQAETGIRQSAFDRLYSSLRKDSTDFQARQREFTGVEQAGLSREYQSILDAINQFGRAQGSALDRIVEDEDAEYDRRAAEYLRGVQNEQRREAIAAAQAARRAQRRSGRFSDILGAAATIGGAALGGPAGAGIGNALGRSVADATQGDQLSPQDSQRLIDLLRRYNG